MLKYFYTKSFMFQSTVRQMKHKLINTMKLIEYNKETAAVDYIDIEDVQSVKRNR